jgi:GR25 family glycosyltransferase involved in LPS biosynthesis
VNAAPGGTARQASAEGHSAGATPDVAASSSAAPLGIFAINLDRSPDRWATIDRYFGKLPWPLYRTPAIDARRDPEAALAVRGQKIILPPDGVGWNPYRFRIFSLVEEACLSSHLSAWRQFLQTGHERGLILEDDAEPQAGFEEAVGALLTEGPPIDIVKLEGIPRPGGRLAIPIRPLGRNNMLVRSLRPRSGGAGYILTRHAAERLLEKIDKLCMPVDDFLWSQGTHGLDIAHVSPWVVMQSGASSTMVSARAPNRHVKRRDPVHLGLQVARRSGLRLALWWNAVQGRPWTLFAARTARWLPEGYPKNEPAVSAAKD